MVDNAILQAIYPGLRSYIGEQRWYADKRRSIETLHLIDGATVQTETGQILLCLIRIDYETGDSRQYFVPMTVSTTPGPERFTIAVIESANERSWVQDAPSDPVFREFLVEAGQGRRVAGNHGAFEFEPWQLDGARFTLDSATQSTVLAVEQSNTSIAYGTSVMAKIYRRLEAGQSIEVDMNRYLGSEARFSSIPQLIGAATYHGVNGVIPLALMQQHVGEHRDGWTALTDLLGQQDKSSLDFIAQLGTVTGELHVALAAAPDMSPLCPELVSRQDIETWTRQLIESGNETDWIIGERAATLPDRSKQSARNYLASVRDWTERARGFEFLSGIYKTRVHGDYHLGQVLMTTDDRILIVDFEGEPHRSVQERAAKYSPLKDVSGMLRSLKYATGVSASTLGLPEQLSRGAWLDDWEREARKQFLAAYRIAIAASAKPIAPRDDESFHRAVLALETDKALYEIRYELSSRPDWAWLPLDSLR